MEHFLREYLLPFAGSLLTLLATAALTYLTQWLKTRTGIALEDHQLKTLNEGVESAVWAIEEKAAASCVEKGLRWTSNDKLEWAIDLVLNRFPTLTREEAKARVEAFIGSQWGLGASSKTDEAKRTACASPKPAERVTGPSIDLAVAP